MNKAKEILREAKQESENALSWADYSNYLFDQEGGLLATSFPTKKDREAFMKNQSTRV
jgi:hypothetical protein